MLANKSKLVINDCLLFLQASLGYSDQSCYEKVPQPNEPMCSRSRCPRQKPWQPGEAAQPPSAQHRVGIAKYCKSGMVCWGCDAFVCRHVNWHWIPSKNLIFWERHPQISRKLWSVWCIARMHGRLQYAACLCMPSELVCVTLYRWCNIAPGSLATDSSGFVFVNCTSLFNYFFLFFVFLHFQILGTSRTLTYIEERSVVDPVEKKMELCSTNVSDSLRSFW